MFDTEIFYNFDKTQCDIGKGRTGHACYMAGYI